MGKNLAKTVVQATGLPQNPVEKELQSLLVKHGTSPEDLTLDQLRDVMAEYLQTVFLEIAEQENLSA